MQARFKLVKAKADISNENKSVSVTTWGKSTWARNDLYSLRAQLNIRFITLKLPSTGAVPTGKVFDMAITFNKFGVQLRVDVLSGSN
jgi:hypothetical protein